MIPNEILVGLVAGLASTAAMSLFEYPIWVRWGMEGVSEWHLNQVMMGRLMHRSPESAVAPGLLLHFLHGGLAGIVFVLILPSLPVFSRLVAGVGFGVVLWIIALMIMRPITGIRFSRHPSGDLSLMVGLGGHVLYGLFLGVLVSFI